jgi:hypothetical protein
MREVCLPLKEQEVPGASAVSECPDQVKSKALKENPRKLLEFKLLLITYANL